MCPGQGCNIPMPLRLNRRSGCRRCLNTSRLVGGVGGKGCGGEEGGGGSGDCGGRATVVPLAASQPGSKFGGR
eukprot:scaffold62003_cov38-Phaeocystis_antarctica.AAC.1